MKRYKFISVLIICLYFIIGCSSVTGQLLPTNNDGRYSVTFGEHEVKSEIEMVTIRGHVYDAKSGKALSDVKLIEGCFQFLTTSQGEYSFKTRNLKDNSFFMGAVVYPYRAVETKYIDIHNRKEVIIDFYLALDERPLLECAGGGAHERMQKELNNLK